MAAASGGFLRGWTFGARCLSLLLILGVVGAGWRWGRWVVRLLPFLVGLLAWRFGAAAWHHLMR
jgi:hypothetical protein